MSLLSQASLVVVPSGYKEDVVYSVKPTDGSGDLTFTRASDGTRVNSQGLVERVPWNLLQQSEDFNTGWSKVRYTSTGNSSTAPNGTNTASLIDDGTATGSHIVERKTESLVGQGLTASIYAKYIDTQYLFLAIYETSYNGVCFDIQNGSVGNNTTGAVGTIESVGNGWFRCSVYYAANTRIDPYVSFGLRDDNTAAFESGAGTNRQAYVWGAQAVIGSTAKPYFPTTDRQNVPRLTYEGGCPSLLLEPQRTNLVTYSEQFDNAAWSTTNTSVTANSTTSPDGTTNADLLTDGTANSDHYININVTTASSTTYIQSAWFKKKDSGIYASLRTNGVGPDFFVVFDFDTGSIVGVGSQVSDYGVDSYANGWYRVWMEYTAAPSGYIIGVSNSSSSSIPIYTGTNKGFYIWGAQLEAGSYPTSYIPTTSAAVTRVADAASKTGISSLIGQTEGTIFLEGTIVAEDSSINRRIISISDGSTANDIQIFNRAATNKLEAGSNFGGVSQFSLQSGDVGFNTLFKFALAYKENDIVFYVNGTQVGTDTSASIPATSKLAFSRGDGDFKHEGNINQAALFKTRLTNAELAALTTL